MGLYSWTCHRCGAHVTTRSDITPVGWSGSFNTDSYCPRCTAIRADEENERREANEAYWNSPEGKEEGRKAGLLCLVGGVFAVVAYFLVDSLFYALVAFCVGSGITAFCVGGLKEGLGCSTFSAFVIGAIIVLWGAPPLNIRSSDVAGNQENHQNHMTVSKNVGKQKIPAYLHGVENINNDRDLGNFYFSVANKFYHNEMGLKGTQEQIDAGNKLMVRVYDFLGTSARREMLDIDSMKAFVKNFAGVSDFRRKKALEDLQIGIDKIESLNE